MRIVVALGGNALLQRGQPPAADVQRANARTACRALAPVAVGNELVVSHGNGPQLGLLALQNASYSAVDPYPLDMLGAQTEGMLGYLLQQELGNEMPADRRIVSVLTQVEVDAADPAFSEPSKPIGSVYTAAEAEVLAATKGWTFGPDGAGLRRTVASPRPQRIFGVEPIEWMLERGCVVICAGGGGIPVVHVDEPVPAGCRMVGIEAVIDKDLASSMLALDLEADLLVLVTDVDAVYSGWGTPVQRAIGKATPDELAGEEFAVGSMGPKVEAACRFVRQSGRDAVIGSMSDTAALVAGEAGTVITATRGG